VERSHVPRLSFACFLSSLPFFCAPVPRSSRSTPQLRWPNHIRRGGGAQIQASFFFLLLLLLALARADYIGQALEGDERKSAYSRQPGRDISPPTNFPFPPPNFGAYARHLEPANERRYIEDSLPRHSTFFSPLPTLPMPTAGAGRQERLLCDGEDEDMAGQELGMDRVRFFSPPYSPLPTYDKEIK